MDKACAAFWLAPLSIFISGSHLFDYMRANYAMDPKAFRCAPCLYLLLALCCHDLLNLESSLCVHHAGLAALEVLKLRHCW